ncbi:hypothetical protein [Streptomyces millisiae]|uniref:Endo-acting ulvan lyase C-terminal domain-containing protein n=1 Tax=Streptomyces millisiae TaxID=3075542 RepID=A0ABU2LHH6_9ACTN|nr:hypothetical protein [Streptomyces sp. DSM 44918]MDT0317039.1 hypothetical protein [Streptomyces sp. DSM 44918]
MPRSHVSNPTRRHVLASATGAAALLALGPADGRATAVGRAQTSGSAVATHPQVYVTATDREAVLDRVARSDWATRSFAALKATIDPLADRHLTDPAWILSRMAMFWKEGERYTQVYIKDQRFDRAEGNAPVPTVRYPAMRIWNANRNVPLADRIPYSEDGSMMSNNGLVPYAETGHMVRLNNEEILAIAGDAGFLHWVTGEEKYARFAADIYWQWLLGVYYMNPALDPERSLGGPGGYEPGGIGGYYDYEVIHDPMGGLAAVVYDFVFDHLQANPHPHLAEIGKGLIETSGIVFKRFIDINRVRGFSTGNWNINGWGCVLDAILALEPNAHYLDGRGREYYLESYTETSTEYHQALPDILTEYNPVTGLWPESPVYSFGTIGSLLKFSVPVAKAGVDTIADNDTLRRASLAIVPWLDGRGNMVVFGDGRGGSPGYTTFERLLSYYTRTGQGDNAQLVSDVLRNAIAAGQYSRNAVGWLGIVDGTDLVPAGGAGAAEIRAAYSAHHRHITLKNRNDAETGLMATLYGGYDGAYHLTDNGLAVQFYGKGWALSPNAKAYESYWSADYGYHRGAAGANTILPGYRQGPVTVNAIEPAVSADAFTGGPPISPHVSFADVTAAEKRRQIAIVRTSPTTGYYVDVFRSDQEDNDYLHHNLGHRLELTDASGTPLSLAPATDLGTEYDAAYAYFTEVRSAAHDGDLSARWTIDASAAGPAITMNLWLVGQSGRTVYQVEAPPTTIVDTVTPAGVNKAPDTTPTLIVRQNGNNAATAPFVGVFEPSAEGERSVRRVRDLGSTGAFAGLKVTSGGGSRELRDRVERILSATDDATHTLGGGLTFRGTFGVTSENRDGFQYLYLGLGHRLFHGDHGIEAAGDEAVAAGLRRADDGLEVSAAAPVRVTLPTGRHGRRARLHYDTGDGWNPADQPDNDGRTVSGVVPAGHGTRIRVAT